MTAPLDDRIRDSYAKITTTFLALGYPHKVLEGWVLPERDAITLISALEARAPKNILEVGTFVGFATLLMALHTPEETHIHSIDPDLPLEVEMSSTQNPLEGVAGDLGTQAIALQAAIKLGLEKRITFHRGGYSCGATFSSRLADPKETIPVIGEAIGSKHGPFDFILIDGLHFEDAVFSDLNLAEKHLLHDGLITVHDVKGRWGGNIRRAVFRFLEEHEGFCFWHEPYAETYKAIGLIQRYDSEAPVIVHPEGTSYLKQTGLIQPSILNNLSIMLLDALDPHHVLVISNAECNIAPFLEEAGISTDSIILDQDPTVLPLEITRQIENKYDLILCLGVLDRFPNAQVNQWLETLCRMSDRIVMAVTPPGEMDVSSGFFRPIAYWVRSLATQGFIMKDTLRPRLEPIAFADQFFSEYSWRSSYLCNLFLVERSPEIISPLTLNCLSQDQRRNEDITLQYLHIHNMQMNLQRSHHELREESYLQKHDLDIANLRINNSTIMHNKKLENEISYLRFELSRYERLGSIFHKFAQFLNLVLGFEKHGEENPYARFFRSTK